MPAQDVRQLVFITSHRDDVAKIGEAIKTLGGQAELFIVGPARDPNFRLYSVRTKLDTNFRSEPMVADDTLVGYVKTGKIFVVYGERDVGGRKWLQLTPDGGLWVAGWVVDRI